MIHLVIRILAVVIIGVVLGGCTDSRMSSSSEGRPSSSNSTLPARWWIWTESVPAAHNPIDDPTGRDCAVNQPDDVWFLAGTHGGSVVRECTIPTGRPVYLPVLNVICPVEDGTTAERTLRGCAGAIDEASATVDGRSVRSKVATSEGAFTLAAQPDSSTISGRHSVVTWGTWLGPLPLDAGHHTLHIVGRSGSFVTDVTYRLTVLETSSSG